MPQLSYRVRMFFWCYFVVIELHKLSSVSSGNLNYTDRLGSYYIVIFDVPISAPAGWARLRLWSVSTGLHVRYSWFARTLNLFLRKNSYYTIRLEGIFHAISTSSSVYLIQYFNRILSQLLYCIMQFIFLVIYVTLSYSTMIQEMDWPIQIKTCSLMWTVHGRYLWSFV